MIVIISSVTEETSTVSKALKLHSVVYQQLVALLRRCPFHQLGH